MTAGYTEFIHDKDGIKMGFIVNSFNRILYINRDFPDGQYEKMDNRSFILKRELKKNCVQGRTFTMEDLMLELL